MSDDANAIVIEFSTVEEKEEFEATARAKGMTIREYVEWLFTNREKLDGTNG